MSRSPTERNRSAERERRSSTGPAISVDAKPGVRREGDRRGAGTLEAALELERETAGSPASTARQARGLPYLRTPSRSSHRISAIRYDMLDTVTTREAGVVSSAGRMRPVNAKWPRWLVPKTISKRSTVRENGRPSPPRC